MAKIVFCWELGQGLGHVAPHLALIRRLLARGDEVQFLAKDAQRTATVFAGMNVEVTKITPGFTPPDERIRSVDSYPEVLHNCGFNDADRLGQRLGEFVSIVEALRPDVLIADFSPTLLLANVILGYPLVMVGDGYTVPPVRVPMPRFRYWLGPPPSRAAAVEAAVLANMNGALATLTDVRLKTFADLLRKDYEWLNTFRELDFYPGRDSARYLGISAAAGFGMAPRWPANQRPRIFAYLAPGEYTSAVFFRSPGAAR